LLSYLHKKINSFKIYFKTGAATGIGTAERLKYEAIAWYEGASFRLIQIYKRNKCSFLDIF
jgi:hypothetical protein